MLRVAQDRLDLQGDWGPEYKRQGAGSTEAAGWDEFQAGEAFQRIPPGQTPISLKRCSLCGPFLNLKHLN
jgi:hypothetical protein